MKYIKRFSVIFFAIVLLFTLLPFQAFAVDPVSASVIANAFAQAIASYGAANGVAMTFDVSSTDGIGETVHELWKRFREGQQTADDYATIAQAIFPELYYKTSTAIGTASDVYAVGVHISDTYAETLDNFYNWLLSGPAEMVQVDNQYYEFSQAQIGDNSSPIEVISVSSGPWANQPIPVFSSTPSISDLSSLLLFVSMNGNGQNDYYAYVSSDITCFLFSTLTSGISRFYICSATQYDVVNICRTFNGNLYSEGSFPVSDFDSSNSIYYRTTNISSSSPASVPVPVFSSLADGLSAASSILIDGVPSDNVGVQAYNPSGIADIPDTADPNYDALNRAKDIPLNIPWDDAIYGDGSGALTDAQSAAIAGDLTLALETDRTVELVEEQDIPIQPDYSDVLLPLIPINIPSFNFSLSGIWHYVRSWVTSLGAWLSMMFSVWGILPYAIVVPVYACLVIVIVLGLYKRFFM